MENNAKKSGKAGYIITIIFLLIVIVILSVLFAFKETIFPAKQVASNNIDTNTLISNDIIENTLATENTIAQNQAKLINSVKGYWVSTTGDQFLAIVDTTDSLGTTTTNFSLTGASGTTYMPCTIDATKITCESKVYNYALQGKNLILSYDNVTRNFVASNLYQLSKQSKTYYANMMGYSLGVSHIPDGVQITGDYANKALLGTWESAGKDTQLVFSLDNNSLVVSKINKSTREILSNLPVGMTQKYIEFVNNSSLSEEAYEYQFKDAKTLVLSEIVGDSFTEYTKISNEQTAKLTISDVD